MDFFTNREVALIVWIVILFIILLFNKQTRYSILSVIKRALNRTILGYFLLFLIYFSLFVYCFCNLNWWDLSNLKDTIIWFVFSGLPIGFVVASNKLEDGFWKNLILKNLKFIVLVEFLIDTFTFSLIVELVMVPIITAIALVNTISGLYEEYKDVEKSTNIIVSVFGLFILFYFLYGIVTEYNSIGTVSTLQYLLFPILYSIISIPYMYIFKLYIEYDTLFRRLKSGKKRSKELDLLIKLRLLVFCNIQLKRLQIAANMGNYNISSISSKNEIDVMIGSYKDALYRDT